MLTCDEIRERLQDRNCSKIAEKTGIHQETINNIRTGRSDNPQPATRKVLSDYLTAYDRVSNE